MTEIEEERMWLKCLELERENKRLREAAKVYISDVSEYGESFCLAAGHDPATCN
jgi:hypothetical protein